MLAHIVDQSSELHDEANDYQVDTITTRKAKIKRIFQDLSGDNSRLITIIRSNRQDVAKFKNQLQAYEIALIKEIDYLGLKYDHPLRSAQSLLNLSNETGDLDTFIKESNNSKFNPKVRAAAWGVLAGIVTAVLFTALIVGILAAVACPITASAIGIAFGTCSTSLSLISGSFTKILKDSEYAPVFNSVNSSKDLAHFFKQAPDLDRVEVQSQAQRSSLT